MIIVSVQARAVPAIADCEVSFSASAIEDTVLTHESTFIKVEIKNTDSIALRYPPSHFFSDFIELTVTCIESGEMCHKSNNHEGSRTYLSLAPGESVVLTSDILMLGSCTLDTFCVSTPKAIPFRQPGTYVARFKFARADWCESASATHLDLIDTVLFTVKADPPSETVVLQSLKEALCSEPNDSRRRIAGLWRVIGQYPTSEYASEAARYIGFSLTRGHKLRQVDDNVELVRDLMMRRPYDEDISNVLTQLWPTFAAEKRDERLSDLALTLPPDSPVRERLKTLIDETKLGGLRNAD